MFGATFKRTIRDICFFLLGAIGLESDGRRGDAGLRLFGHFFVHLLHVQGTKSQMCHQFWSRKCIKNRCCRSKPDEFWTFFRESNKIAQTSLHPSAALREASGRVKQKITSVASKRLMKRAQVGDTQLVVTGIEDLQVQRVVVIVCTCCRSTKKDDVCFMSRLETRFSLAKRGPKFKKLPSLWPFLRDLRLLASRVMRWCLQTLKPAVGLCPRMRLKVTRSCWSWRCLKSKRATPWRLEAPKSLSIGCTFQIFAWYFRNHSESTEFLSEESRRHRPFLGSMAVIVFVTPSRGQKRQQTLDGFARLDGGAHHGHQDQDGRWPGGGHGASLSHLANIANIAIACRSWTWSCSSCSSCTSSGTSSRARWDSCASCGCFVMAIKMPKSWAKGRPKSVKQPGLNDRAKGVQKKIEVQVLSAFLMRKRWRFSLRCWYWSKSYTRLPRAHGSQTPQIAGALKFICGSDGVCIFVLFSFFLFFRRILKISHCQAAATFALNSAQMFWELA